MHDYLHTSTNFCALSSIALGSIGNRHSLTIGLFNSPLDVLTVTVLTENNMLGEMRLILILIIRI